MGMGGRGQCIPTYVHRSGDALVHVGGSAEADSVHLVNVLRGEVALGDHHLSS